MSIVGRIGIPYDAFFILNLSERESLLDGHESNHRDKLYLARRQTMLLLEIHLSKGHGLNEGKIWPFEWEKPEETEWSTKEDYDNARKTLDIVKNIKNGKS